MKKLTDKEYIQELIAEGEHEHQDFKFEISDARKIAKSFSAFANTKGGRLLVGVKDNGKIAGVRSEEEIYMIQAAASMYCQPKISIKTKPFNVEGKTVLEVDIEESPIKPVYALDEQNKPWAYVRIKDENIQATIVHMKVWQQIKAPNGTLLTFTEKEELLLRELKERRRISLSQCCKLCKLNRQKATDLLADFIRFGIISPIFVNHHFMYEWNKKEL
ncbi:MAG: AlbA family DNA-binding domain-containing protein [Phocaeicola sp.]|uniref:AlbA family DNA-binding domain-containing protein n=1 Tax=Phocaeicola TaxID=909656 RepID=UPI00234F77F6|nr:ATP-binding protein [Phocaeicola oris]MCE2615731.1 ATP-binding protein [Phocaeicola oris]